MLDRILDFLRNCSATDLLFLGTLILIPFITIVLIIVAIANGKKRKVAKAEDAVAVEEVAPVEETVETKEHRVRYITTAKAPEKVKVKVRVKNLCKVDQSLLIATGIFGVGLGMMIHRAADDTCRR